MYNLRDKNVLFKYKGHQNSASQLRASLTTDSAYLISGSEDCRIYIWNADGKFQKKGLGSFFNSFRKDHIDSYESFKGTFLHRVYIVCILYCILYIHKINLLIGFLIVVLT